MISFEKANNIISEEFNKLQLGTEENNLIGALNRVLAETILSDIDLPPFDNSSMDGYAIKFNPNIKEWKVNGEITAGNYRNYNVDESSTVRIMTGGKLPKNCDTVIPIEDVDVTNEFVQLKETAAFSCGINIRKKGEDLLKGEIAVEKDTILKPHNIAVAASCGKSKLKTFKKLKIGILTTGDELIDINIKPDSDKIRASNLYSLYTAVKETNMKPISFGIIKDNKSVLFQKVKNILNKKLDILLTSGGVSVGKYDYLKEVFEELGVTVKFWRVLIKPGKPILFGIYNNNDHQTLIFGLPGNPVSSLVAYIVFVRRHILELYGNQELTIMHAVLKDNISKQDKKRHFIRGVMKKVSQNEHEVTLSGHQSSGNLVQMGKANCLILIEEEKFNPKIGDTVECIMI